MRKNINLIQTQLFQCHREEQSDVAILLIHLKRLPRPFRARNDIVKIYIAFILGYSDNVMNGDKVVLRIISRG